jgi:CHAT domain-containing protein
VLREYGQHGRRHHRNKWWQAGAVISLFLLVALIPGCQSARWDHLQADAQLKIRQGYLQKGIEEANEGLSATSRSYEWNWKFRLVKADGLLRSGSAQQAIETLQPEPPQGLASEIFGRRLVLRGLALCRSNRHDDGEIALEKAGSVLPSNRPDLQAELAFAYGGCVLRRDRNAAKRFYAQAAQLATGQDSFVQASALINLGYLSMGEHRYDDAIVKLQQALHLTDSPYSREKTLGNLGASYSELGEYRTAIENSRQAAEIASQLGLMDDEAGWLLDVGHSYQALREFTEAESYLQRSLSLSRKLGDHINEALCLNNLTRMAIKEQQLQKAEQYWREESSIADVSPGTKSYAALDAAAIALASKDYHQAEAVLEALVADANANPVLHAITLGNLAQVYAAERKSDAANKTFLRSVEAAEKARSKVSESFRMSFLDEFPFYDAYVQFLLKQHKPLAALQVAERGRAITLMEGIAATRLRRSELDLRSIQSFLKGRNETLLTFWVTEEQSYLWLISPGYFKVFYLPGHKELHDQVEAANKEIQDRAILQNSTQAERLYQTVIAPAAGFIPHGSKVIVIPSRVLCLTSFEALVAPNPSPHYWIEDVEIQKTSSISLLLLNSEDHAAPPAKDLLLIGAPVEVNKKDFPALPHAMDEIQDIEPHFDAARETVISGKDATPQAYLESHPEQYRVIHFVTHGTANEQHPLDSAIVLSPGQQNSYMLYAGEIMKKPIDADLVTISACYGAGLRWYLSESTVGLGWAFIRAGAHHVIAALWEVDDEGTPKFMDHFYSQLSSGKTCAEALRAVKLEMLKEQGPHRHPYFWASLELYAGS